ncbi:two-component sensor histidine kinase [Candidatus Acetothermia bacterium]|nr:MAG: two-component sensor histidine kinase [Candidatus Acetothermia bacterium]
MAFRWKLIGALVLTAVCAVIGTYLLTTYSVTSRFDEFRVENLKAAAQDLAGLLGEYWQAQRSWEKVERLFEAQVFVRSQGRVIYQKSLLGQFALLDPQLNVVACADEKWRECHMGQDLSPLAKQGIPIVVEGQEVGVLVPLDPTALTPLEEDFLLSVQRAAMVGGVAALAVAAILGSLLIVQLSAPLRKLIRATERIAHGELSFRVRVRGKDEIGRLARAFNRMAEALERSEAARKSLLADVAHELRTPLTVIQGNLEAMLDGVFPLTPESLAPVYEETLHLGALIEDLRVLTLAETGHLPLAKERVDLAELVEGACEAIRPAAADEGIEVAVEVEAEPGLTVEADPIRIRQVLSNLLANALRHSPPGSTIRVRAYRDGGEARVEVHDQGPGIAPEDLPHIFERFYRGDPARSGEGTGLGLAIARELVRLHGGRIWAESQDGATFTFALPLVAEDRSTS